jgi:hypothetical protein
MPEVTLLKPSKNDFTIVKGSHAVKFVGKKPQKVSVAIALVCAKKMDDKGRPMFSVSGMPDIVKPVSKTEPTQNVPMQEKTTRKKVQQTSLFK